jgi:hypothetical protein
MVAQQQQHAARGLCGANDEQAVVVAGPVFFFFHFFFVQNRVSHSNGISSSISRRVFIFLFPDLYPAGEQRNARAAV